MALAIAVVLPAAVTLSSLNTYQTLFGNYPMRIRWQVHRYLLEAIHGLLPGRVRRRIAAS